MLIQANLKRPLQRERIPEFGSSPLVGLILICLLTSTTLVADDNRISREKIHSLIQKLDAKTLAERSHAERELLEFGPQLLKLLPASELIESVPGRESVRRIRLQLERQAARESSGPSRVSLKGELPLGDLLEQIQKQTENRLFIDESEAGLKDERMTVNWEHVTFWACLDDLCERGKLTWQFARDSAAVRISRSALSNEKPRTVQHSGPFRLAVDQIETRAVVGNPRQRLLRVNGRISIEPRLRPLFLTITAADLKAIGDGRTPLEPWNPDARFEHPILDSRREISFAWDFSLGEATDIKHLSINGRIRCQIAASTERVIFDQTSQERGTIRRRGGMSIQLKEITFKDSGPERMNAEIGVSVNYDRGGPAFESHRTWILHNAAYLEIKNGARFDFNDFETTQQSDGGVSIDYRWQNLAAPATQYQFVYEAPTLILDVPMEVETGKFSIGK